MPLQLGEANGQYTPITTAGTTTLNPGQSGVPGVGQQGQQPSSFGVLYGATVASAGTAFAINIYDIIPPTGLGTNTATQSNLLLSGTATQGVNLSAGPAGIGVRYKGALVAVTSGTPGAINAIWD